LRFLFAGPDVCLQIPLHDGHPCCSAIHFPQLWHIQDFHPLELAHDAQTKNTALHLQDYCISENKKDAWILFQFFHTPKMIV